MNKIELVFLINLGVCLAIAWVCICRLNAITRDTMLRVRAKYTALLTGALTLAGLPILFGVKPTVDTALAAALVLILIVFEMPLWRNGPPRCCFRTQRQQE